jgi:hypothetical protein
MSILLFTNCTNDIVNIDTDTDIAEIKTDNAVNFGIYLSDPVKSRADVDLTNITTEILQKSDGFGVYGYYTEDKKYIDIDVADRIPNFFNNEKVTYNSTSKIWEYSPVKYWSKSNTHNFTFLSYAPYQANPDIQFIKGDPYIKYSLSDGYDLLWGTDGVHSVQNIKPRSEQIKFLFKHALARIHGNNTDDKNHSGIDIKYIVDDDAAYIINPKETTVYIQDLKIDIKDESSVTDENGTHTGAGWLNLYTGEWYCDPATDMKFKDVNSTGIIKTYTKSDVAGNLLDDKAGVTNESKPLLKDNLITYMFPGTKPTFTVSITYVIKTLDSKLKDENSSIATTLTRDFKFTKEMKMNAQYKINLILNLYTVKFDAEVEELTSDGDTQSVEIIE